MLPIVYRPLFAGTVNIVVITSCSSYHYRTLLVSIVGHVMIIYCVMIYYIHQTDYSHTKAVNLL